jgi:hypothetical protein
MLFIDKTPGIILWILVHIGQNALWLWILKYGGWEWATGSVRGNRWADDTILKKDILLVIAIFANILAVYGIFDKNVRIWESPYDSRFFFFAFTGYLISLGIVICKSIKFLHAYLAYLNYRRKSRY